MALGAAQVVIGATVGYRFADTPPMLIMRVIGLSFGSTVLLLCTSLIFAALVASLTGDRLIGLMLAYSLGGLAEMSFAALSHNVEVPSVVLHRLIRVFLVIAGSTAVFRPGR